MTRLSGNKVVILLRVAAAAWIGGTLAMVVVLVTGTNPRPELLTAFVVAIDAFCVLAAATLALRPQRSAVPDQQQPPPGSSGGRRRPAQTQPAQTPPAQTQPYQTRSSVTQPAQTQPSENPWLRRDTPSATPSRMSERARPCVRPNTSARPNR